MEILSYHRKIIFVQVIFRDRVNIQNNEHLAVTSCWQDCIAA
jgi:hypothetical protein